MIRTVSPYFRRADRARDCRGISLVLVMVMVCAIMVLMVIFSRLVAVGLRVTRSYSNVLKAELAADAATADAQNLLLELFASHPDSITYWEPRMNEHVAGQPDTPGTVFMWRSLPPNKEYPGTSGTAPEIYYRPLLSGATTNRFYGASGYDDYAKALPRTAMTNSIDINAVPSAYKRSGEMERDSKRWIGVLKQGNRRLGNRNMDPGDEVNYQSIRVPWVEILEHPGDPKDMTIDPATGAAKNPPVARYAYWIEDESFKLNVNRVVAKERGKLADDVDNNGKPFQWASWKGWFGSIAEPNVAESLERARTALRTKKMLSASQLAHATKLPSSDTPENFWNKWRMYLTVDSSGLDLSRTGAKRLNINAASRDSATALSIEQSVKRIVQAIKQNAPHFGQRFYRINNNIGSPSAYTGFTADFRKTLLNAMGGNAGVDMNLSSGGSFSHEESYLYKIAANIRDYINPAPNPTILLRNGTAVAGNGPVYSLRNTAFDLTPGQQENPLLAIGKKKIPYFTEYMMHVKILGADATPGIAAGKKDIFDIEIDHYFEFWNLTNEDIYPAQLGNNPYIILENQPGISVNNGNRADTKDVPAGRPFEIRLNDISGLVFRAGQLTVITTDPTYTSYLGGNFNIQGNNIYVAPKLYRPGTEQIIGGASITDYSAPPFPLASGPVAETNNVANIRRYRCTAMYWDNSGSTSFPEVQIGHEWDAQTPPRFLLGNSNGLLDAHPALNLQAPKSQLVAIQATDQRADTKLNNFRGCYVAGAYYAEADPRNKLDAITLNTLATLSYSGAKPGLSTKADGTTTLSTTVVSWSQPGSTCTMGTLSSEIRSSPSATASLLFWDSDKTPGRATGSLSPVIAAADTNGLKSIAELGHVYDPVRFGANADDAKSRRGGGLTLTIGQPDVLWDGTRVSGDMRSEMIYQTSASRSWAAWRLCDIFTTRGAAEMTGYDLDPTNRMPENYTVVEGLYNPNGILRDEGVVLRALLQGLNFESDSPSVSGTEFETGEMLPSTSPSSKIWDEATRALNALPRGTWAGGVALSNVMARRLTRSKESDANTPLWRFSPFWERGELSQLEVFSPAPPTGIKLTSSANNADLNDRERENVFRRLSEMITMKGNTFSIYVVGEGLGKNGEVTSSKWQRVIVRLHPVWRSKLDDDFDPANTSAVANRFRPPDEYRAEVLNVEDR